MDPNKKGRILVSRQTARTSPPGADGLPAYLNEGFDLVISPSPMLSVPLLPLGPQKGRRWLSSNLVHMLSQPDPSPKENKL